MELSPNDENESPSDTDLSCGLPSPDVSDDEDIQQCQDLGIIVPHFCNKLRTLTQPLFPNPEPVVLSDLFGQKNNQEKTEPKKKSTKDETDVSRRSLSHSGYASSPRWTKSPAMRSYDPCDITGNDEFDVAGVVFKNWAAGKEKQNLQYSKKDSDFPSLNESSQSDISDLSKSIDNSTGLLSISQENKGVHSPRVTKIGLSPITSTPSHSKIRSIISHESPISLPDKQAHISPNIHDSPRHDYLSKLEPRSNSRSNAKSGRRRSKKLMLTPQDDGQSPSVDSSATCDYNANNTFNHPGCKDGSKCELCLEVESLNINKDGSPLSQCKTATTDNVGRNRTYKNSSPILHAPGRKSEMYSERQDVTLDTQNSSLCRLSSPSNEVCVDNKLASPSWSNIVKTSPRLSPVMRIGSPRSFTQEHHSHPATRDDVKKEEVVRKVAIEDRKTPGSKEHESAPAYSRKKNNERRQRIQLVAVDSSVTPSKNSASENWPSQNNADVLAFENRFVEKIAVSSTSPPKKVNPSPIKKLDFSQKGKGRQSIDGQGKENKGYIKNDSLFRRQVSLISDLDWKRSATNDYLNNSSKGNLKGNKTWSKEKNGRGRRAMFSLEDYAKTQDSSKGKDEIQEDEEVEDQKDSGVDETKTKVDEFWAAKSVGGGEEMTTGKSRSENSYVGLDTKQVKAKSPPEWNVGTGHGSGSVFRHPDSGLIVVDVTQVTMKSHLRKYARRYCHYVEGHLVTNVSREILFILQLLTCSHGDCQGLKELDTMTGNCVFGSVQNCVYFAVMVMKRLRRLFSCLPKATLCLLVSNPYVKAFSPKLHNFLKECLLSDKFQGTKEEMLTGSTPDLNAIGSSQKWSSTFSDSKLVHVFKCQRDNFYALYHRYHDSVDDHLFRMEEQIHYVYDQQIAGHNSVVNLMHLAHLFLDVLIESNIKQSHDQVKFFEMVICKETDSAAFKKEFDKWRQSYSALKFGSPPRWNKSEIFFTDFIKAIRCPSFNELLKNIIASKILELNGTDFEYLKTLHSSICLLDDQTPQRCERFTTTSLRLCLLGKMLGHLVFAPYSGGEDLSPEETYHMVMVREMVPLPLPLPLILKQARESGHLSLTVPWIVQYLSMMDATAPKLTPYSHLINQLSSIHRHSWTNLYSKGYHNTGLLLTSCISWLFENPALPAGLMYSGLSESLDVFLTHNPQAKCLDTQRVVTSHLLFSCCPYLNAGHIPLVMSAINHKTVSRVRPVMSLVPGSQPVSVAKTLHRGLGCREVDDLCQWLGSSLHARTSDGPEKMSSDKESSSSQEGQTAMPYFFAHVFHNANDSLGEIASNFLQGHPYLSHCIHRAVELMCGKVQDYALNTILKLAVFDARVKVRQEFMNMDTGQDADSVKSCILANSNIMARDISRASVATFLQTGDRVCQSELPYFIHFLASHIDESIRTTAINIAQKAVMSRLLEWAGLQLGADVFRKAVVSEVEKLASTWNYKGCSLYPSDHMRKLEYAAACPDLTRGFEHLHQMSKVLDTALACGSWYMNGQTRGPRPDDTFVRGLMGDFMACIDSNNVSMDFSFAIMVNFLMHLVIQYIVDAPQNWTDSCLETFIRLCVLFESKKNEDDHNSFQPIESSHKSKKLKMKLTNLMSVYSLEWLSTSQSMDHSLMVYCHTLVKLVEANLVSVEKTMDRLTTVRVNNHLNATTKLMIDRIMVKILELLFTSKCVRTEGVVSMVFVVLDFLTDWGSDQALTELGLTFGDVVRGNQEVLQTV